jgi:hypothetical protein
VRCAEHGKVLPHYRCDESERWLDALASETVCRVRTGVIWKADGEVCSCIRLADHSEPNHPAGTWHVCSCNAWFDDSCVRWRPGDSAEKGAA